MTGNKKRNTASNQEDEDDLIPDMTAPSHTGRFPKARVTRARPKPDTPKVSTTIRFDPDARARCRAGWRSRRNAALSPWPAEHRSDGWRYIQGAPVYARYRQSPPGARAAGGDARSWAASGNRGAMKYGP